MVLRRERSRPRKGTGCQEPDIVIALVGNANVGKSVIFNQLTGLEQAIGNWPGKTVKRAEGILFHHGKRIRVLDLPGIYSMSAYSAEETVSRDFIALEKPDVLVNVVDATALERNLFLTLQLIEMGVPIVLALNLVDIAKKRGINVDSKRLQRLLGVPVIPTVATRGEGVHEIVDKAIALTAGRRKEPKPRSGIRYGPEIEARIEKLCAVLGSVDVKYPCRWTAIKLFEGDTEIRRLVRQKKPAVLDAAKILSDEISQLHRESCPIAVASERYAVAARIAGEVQTFSKVKRRSAGELLDSLTMHGVWGYVLMFLMMLSILTFISIFGEWVARVIAGLFERFHPNAVGFWSELVWHGAVMGFYAALSVAVGFILPFYIILGFLEDSGYLPKVAYLMDRPCHTIGVHGKACMPLLLAFGCNALACSGCRIMENRRDKFIAIFLSTLIPCSARTAVILGLVGAFVGLQWAIALYVIDFAIVIAVGRALNRLLPGTTPGLIMEIPRYRTPSPGIVLKQVWSRFREFVIIAIPLILAGSTVIEAMRLTNLLEYVSDFLSPVTVLWLGLPAFTGILLIIGILRKEATLALLVTIAGMNIAAVMTPVQMIVFCLVIMLYIPCVTTIAVLVKETGWKDALMVTVSEIGLAILIGGIAMRVLSLWM